MARNTDARYGKGEGYMSAEAIKEADLLRDSLFGGMDATTLQSEATKDTPKLAFSPIFAGLSGDLIEKIIASGETVEYQNNDFLTVKDADSGLHPFYLIPSGAQVAIDAGSGDVKTTMHQVGLLSGLIPDERPTATVKFLEPATVHRIPNLDLLVRQETLRSEDAAKILANGIQSFAANLGALNAKWVRLSSQVDAQRERVLEAQEEASRNWISVLRRRIQQLFGVATTEQIPSSYQPHQIPSLSVDANRALMATTSIQRKSLKPGFIKPEEVFPTDGRWTMLLQGKGDVLVSNEQAVASFDTTGNPPIIAYHGFAVSESRPLSASARFKLHNSGEAILLPSSDTTVLRENLRHLAHTAAAMTSAYAKFHNANKAFLPSPSR